MPKCLQGLQARDELSFTGTVSVCSVVGTSSYVLVADNLNLPTNPTADDFIAGEITDVARVQWVPGSITPTTTQALFPSQTLTVTNGGGTPVSFDTVLLLWRGRSTWGVNVSSVSTTQLTVPGHGCTVGEAVMFTNEAASAPTNMSLSAPGSVALYYVVTVLDANTIEVSSTPGGGAVSFGSSFTGTLEMRFASGAAEDYTVSPSATQVAASQSVSVNVENIGSAIA